MKQLKLFFTVLFLAVLGLGNVWATDPDVTFMFKTLGVTSGTSSTGNISFETGKTGSATATACNATNGLVLYGVSGGGGYFNTTSATSKAIESITVVSTAKKHTPKYTAYGSTNGTDWTEIEGDIAAGTKNFDVSDESYTYFKIHNTTGATAQLGVTSISFVLAAGGGDPEPTKYTVTVASSIANGTVTASPTSAKEGDVVTLTATPSTGYEFGSWNVTNASTSAAITVTDNKFQMPAANVNVSATFNEVQADEYTHDVLTNADFAATSTTYTDFSNVSKNTAVYAGNSAKNNGIQLRSNNSNSGVVSTTSGGKIKTVTVTWNSNCADARVIDVYGSNTAYTAAANLYSSSAQGTKLGSITKGTSTSVTVTGDYAYVGIRSNSGSLNIDQIDFAWEEGGSDPEKTAVSVTVDNEQSIEVDATLDVTSLFTVTTADYDGSLSYAIKQDENKDKASLVGTTLTGVAAGVVTIVATAEATENFAAVNKEATVTVTAPVVPFTGETWEITASDLAVLDASQSSGYAKYAGTQTKDGVDYNITAVMPQTGNMQMQKNTGVLYNESTFGKIAKIVVTSASTVLSLYEGEDVAPAVTKVTGVSADGDITYTLSGNNGYFKLVNGNTTTTISKITVYYYPVKSTITLASCENGSVGVDGIADLTQVKAGAVVALTNTPAAGYELDAYSVVDAESNPVSVTDGKFTMPASNVTVSATFKVAVVRVETPTLTEAGDPVYAPKSITIACATDGASIYYTLDGSDPTTSSTEYAAPFDLTKSCTVKAIAVKDGMENSYVATQSYVVYPVYASLAELVAAGAPTAEEKPVKVSFTDEMITSLFVSQGGKRQGVFVQSGSQEIEFYCGTNEYPETWKEYGKISATSLEGMWTLYKGTWELKITDWTGFSYADPEETPTTPTYASLQELLTAEGEPTTGGKDVIVSFENQKITKLAGGAKGIYMMVGEQEIEIYCNTANPADPAWETRGLVSATELAASWKKFNSTWELVVADWTGISYTAPAPLVLTGLTISGEATALEYAAGDVFNPAGLVVTGIYNNGEDTKVLSEGFDWEFTPATLSEGNTSVSVVASVDEISSEAFVVNGLTVAAADTRKTATNEDVFTATSGNLNSDISYEAFKGDASTEPAIYNDGIRLYQNGGYIVLSAVKGCKIDEVILTTTDTYATTVGYSINNEELPSEGDVIAKSSEWKTAKNLKAEKVNIVCLGSDNKARLEIAKIVVKYTGEAVAPVRIELNTDDVKKSFEFGETFNSDNLVVEAVYENSDRENVTAKAEVVAPDMSTSGGKTVYVNYLTFSANYTITIAEPAPAPEATPYYLISDTWMLEDGDVVVLGCAKEGTVAGALGGNAFLASQAATFADGVCKASDAMEFELNKVGDNWTLTSTEGVLGTFVAKKMTTNAETNNYVGTWTIEIADGVATIASTNTAFGAIKFNASSPRFLNYASGQTDIEIYSKVKKNVVERPLTGMGTHCYPYTIKADKYAGARFYIPAYHIGNTKIYWDEVTGDIEAGKPYLVVLEEGSDKLVYLPQAESVSDPIAVNYGMVGAFVQTDISNTGYYIVYNNEFRSAGNYVAVGANRAYIDLSAEGFSDKEVAPVEGRRRIVMNNAEVQAPTGISNQNASAVANKVMKDGHIYIIRGEKMFDTTGRLVK